MAIGLHGISTAQSRGGSKPTSYLCERSSGIEHYLAKVGVEDSNPFARFKFRYNKNDLAKSPQALLC
jgi:hypothetical protein